MSLLDGMISECGSEASRPTGELTEMQGRWSETEAMLKAVKNSRDRDWGARGRDRGAREGPWEEGELSA